MTITISQKLSLSGGRPSGFDYLRIGLATLVFINHVTLVAFGEDAAHAEWAGPLRPLYIFILPAFFALSGFLVAGSLERCKSVISFGGLRIIRLMPALFVETILCALVLGPIFTAYPLKQYFTDPLFFRYFSNIIGHVQFYLPGVFVDNPTPLKVNGQLWTLPYELYCYATLCGIAIFGLLRSKKLFLISVGLLYVLAVSRNISTGTLAPERTVPGLILVVSFLMGVAAYLMRQKIPYSHGLALVAFMIFLALCYLPGGHFLTPAPVCYLVAYLGLMQPARLKLLFSGDYSYGIFLFGTPIQQAVVAALGDRVTHWWVSFGVAFPITVAFAVASWWLIEKPAQRFKPALLRFEDRVLRWSSSKSKVGQAVFQSLIIDLPSSAR